MTMPFKNLTWTPIALWILATPLLGQETPETWYESGQERVEKNLSLRQRSGEAPLAKNIILVIL